MSISLKNDAGTFITNLNQSNPTENVNIALPTTSGTMAKVEDKLVLGTAYTFTGTETFKDFTGIPSWAKRVTVMLIGVSTNGSSLVIVQLGDAGGVENTGYISKGGYVISGNATSISAITNGLAIDNFSTAGDARTGNMTICTITQNSYIAGYLGEHSGASLALSLGTSSKTLSDVLDRIRITTVNGTDLFDAGTINIMWE